MATLKQLKDAYQEMIDVMELTENKKPIEIPDDADEDYLVEKIKAASEYIDPAIDQFSKKTLTVLDELSEEEEEEEEEAPSAPKKKGKKPEKAGEPGKPGIIATIVKAIEDSGKKGITKTEILEILKEEFPDRNEDSMKNTINVQVPARIQKEKFKLEKLEGERWTKAKN
jgi:hypothetical protein